MHIPQKDYLHTSIYVGFQNATSSLMNLVQEISLIIASVLMKPISAILTLDEMLEMPFSLLKHTRLTIHEMFVRSLGKIRGGSG